MDVFVSSKRYRAETIHLFERCPYVKADYRGAPIEHLGELKPVCECCQRLANGESSHDFAQTHDKSCPMCGRNISGTLPDHLPCDAHE